MATESRQSSAVIDEASPDAMEQSLHALMEAEPYGFRFFQMVRLLEKLHPERKPVGLFVSPSDEVVRFTAAPALSFSPKRTRAVPAKRRPPGLA